MFTKFGSALLVAALALSAVTHANAAADGYVPYTGNGDPAGLTASGEATDALTTGSAGGGYVPYTGYGDPAGLTASDA
jgi:hypothetical protein